MNTKGQTLIIISVFLTIILAFSLIVSETFLRNQQVSRTLNSQMTAVNLAEAGVQKAIFCLNSTTNPGCGSTYGLSYAGESNVALDTGTFTTTVSGSGTERQVTVTGRAANGIQETVKVTLIASPDTTNFSFGFAVQVGFNGVEMGNNAKITGSIYANGPITCNPNAEITEDATAADPEPGDAEHDGSLIQGCIVGRDALAHTLEDNEITRDAYFKTLISSTVGGVQYPDSPEPPVQPFPITGQQIQDMKDDAASGGTILGDYSPPSEVPVYLGPKRITGDLILENNQTLILTGTVWVEGKVSMSNNVITQLDPGYGAGTGAIVSDGFMEFENNVQLLGSGTENSYLLVLSLSDGSDNPGGEGMVLGNNVAGSIFYAPNGILRMRNNAGVKELTADKLILDNNVEITYETGLTSATYTPTSGGSFIIKRGTWTNL